MIQMFIDQCAAGGLGPIGFPSYESAIAFLKLLAGGNDVEGFVKLLQVALGDAAPIDVIARNAASVLKACMGTPT